MSSGSASAITALIAPPAAAPEAPIASVVADASAPSVFSRLLDAEAQLAQTVAQFTQSAAPLPAAVAAAPAAPMATPELAPPLDLTSDAVPSNRIAVESHVALALAQAAQAGLSQAEHAQQEPLPVDASSEDTSATADLPADSETATPRSAPAQSLPRAAGETAIEVSAETEPASVAVTVPASPQKPTTDIPATTVQNDAGAPELEFAAPEQKEAAPVHTASHTKHPTVVNAEPIALDAPAKDVAPKLQKKVATVDISVSEPKTSVIVVSQKPVPAQNESETAVLPADVPKTNLQPVGTVFGKAKTSIAANSSTYQTEKTFDVQAPKQSDVAAINAMLQSQGTRSIAPFVRTVAAGVEPVSMNVVESDQAVRADTEEELTASVESALPAEVFLGAAGVLNVTFTPASPVVRGTTATEEDTVSASFASDTLTEEPVAPAHAEIVNREAVAKTPVSRDVQSSKDLSEWDSEADSASDSAADAADTAEKTGEAAVALRPASSNPTRSTQQALPRSVESLPEEVRVIASNSPRETTRESAADANPVKTEFQAKAPALRTEANDVKSEQTVDRTRSSTTLAAPVVHATKAAWKGSPEGFSSDARQSEISASAMTAPFSDGGRPETIASRNSTPTPALTEAPRPDRVLTQTLEAIPNPLRVTTFEIRPEGHGPIRVRISARGEGENTVWRVQIHTNDSAARSLLNDHMNELRERLPAENVTVELGGASADVRTEAPQRETSGGWRERGGEQRQSRGEEQQRQPKQQKGSDFLEWLAAQK